MGFQLTIVGAPAVLLFGMSEGQQSAGSRRHRHKTLSFLRSRKESEEILIL